MATRTGAGRKAGSNAGTRTGTEPTLTATLLEASIANSGRAAPARRVTAGSRRTARPRSTGEVARAARPGALEAAVAVAAAEEGGEDGADRVPDDSPRITHQEDSHETEATDAGGAGNARARRRRM